MADRNPLARGAKGRESAEFSEKIRSRTDEREAIHKKTFTRWINNKLSKAEKPVEVKDLIEDLRDGHVLLTLLETLLSTKLQREKGKMRLHKLSNIKTVFEQLEKNGVKIVGINGGDVVDGMARPILGLVWSIILRFQVHELFQESAADSKAKDFTVEKKLLSWCQDVLDGYEDLIKLKDFTVGWRNGLAFNALIHSHKPELFKFDELLENDNMTNLQHAFTMAQQEYDVDPLLEPSDIDVPQPDKKLIMMYLTSMYDVLKDHNPTRERKNQKIKLKLELDSYRASYSEIILYISQVETIVLAKQDSDGQQVNPKGQHQIAKDLTRDSSAHVNDVNDVTLKGQKLLEDGKISKADQKEIKTQINELEIRWEKLVLMISRLSKSSQRALVSRLQEQVEYYIKWVRQTSRDIQLKGNATTFDEIKKKLLEVEDVLIDIEENQPSIEVIFKEGNEVCQDDSMDKDIKHDVESGLNVLKKEWEQLKLDTSETQIKFKQLEDSSAVEEQITVVKDVNTVESAPPMDTPTYQVEIRRIKVQSPPTSPRLEKSEQIEKLQTWKRKHDEARDAISECDVIVKKLKLEEDVKQFYEQYEVCNHKIQKADPIVLDTVRHGQTILQDHLMEEQTEVVSRELETLVSDYDDLLLQVDETKLKMDEQVKGDASRVKVELESWKTSRDELRLKISECYLDVKKAKSKPIPGQRVELLLYATEVENCHQGITSLEPEVNALLDSGNELIQNKNLANDDKEIVARNMHEIDNQFVAMKNDNNELKYKVDEVIHAESAKKDKKMNEWKTVRDDLKSKISKQLVRLKVLKGKDAPSKPVVQVQQAQEIEACFQEVAALDHDVNGFVDQSNELLNDGKLDDGEKDLVTKDMNEIDEQYEDLRRESKELKDKVEELVENEEKKTFDLMKWREWKNSICSNLDSLRDATAQIKSIETSKNLESLEDNLRTSKKCMEELENMEPEIKSLLEFGQQIIESGLLSYSEKQEVSSVMDEIEKRFRNLREDSSNQNEWLKVYLEEQETSKADTLAKWWETKQRTSDVIGKCQAKLDGLYDAPSSKDGIEQQNAQLQECATEFQSIFQEVQACFDYGNSLLADELLIQDEKDQVQNDAEEIGNSLKTLQSNLANHQKRLEDLLNQTQIDEKSAMRSSKLLKWRQERKKLDDILKDFQEKFAYVKILGAPKTVAETEDRINLTADLSQEVLSKLSEIQFGYDFGNELLNDDELLESDKDAIENNMEDLRDGFQDLQDDVNDKHERLHKLLEENKEREGKMEKWNQEKKKLNRLLEEAKRVVRDLKSRPEPKTRNEIDDQLDETEVVYRKMAAEAIPEIDDGLSYGNGLLKDPIVTDPQKDIIERDLEVLEPELAATRQEFTNYYAWLQSLTPEEIDGIDMTDQGDAGEDKLVVRPYQTSEFYFQVLHDEMTPKDRYEHEKQEKLRHWKSVIDRIDQLLKRLMDKLNRLNSADPKDRADLEQHKEEAQDCTEEIEGSDALIRESIRLGNELLEDKDVPAYEKTKIRSYISTLEIKLKRIQVQADREQQRADRIIEEKYLHKKQEEPIVEEAPVAEQFQERGGDWDWSNLDEEREEVPQSPLRIDSIDQSVHLKFIEKGPTHEYVMTIEDQLNPGQRRDADTEAKLDRWNDCQYNLEDFVKIQKDKLNKVSKEPKDREDVRDKLEEAKECKEQIEKYEPEVVNALDCANEILNDPNVDSKQKDEIKAYISELEVQLKALHRQATHDENRLERLLNESSLDKDRRYTIEEELNVSHQHKPEWELNFSDDEDMGKEDEVIHSMFERGLPHDTFDHLHEDMSPQERRIAEKERKKRDWRSWKEKLDDLIARLNGKLKRAKATDKPRDWNTIKEQKDEAEDCKEEVEDSEPMIREALDSAEDLLDDPDLSVQEKREIKEYVSDLKVRLRTIHRNADAEEKRLRELWISTPHPRNVVEEEQIVEEEPIGQQFQERGGFDLEFEDDTVEEDVHEKFHERGNVNINFDELGHDVVVKGQHSTDSYITLLITDLTPEQRDEMTKAEKLEQWRNEQNKLDAFIDRQRRKLDQMKKYGNPGKKETLVELHEETLECKEEIEDSRPRVIRAVEHANELLQDDELDESEKGKIRKYVGDLEVNLRELYIKACDEEDRLSELLDKLPVPANNGQSQLPVSEEIHHDHRQRSDFDLNFEDDTREGHPDEVIHSMFVPSKPIHDYIWNLHDDLEVGQSHEVEKREKLGRWRNWQDKLDDMLHYMNRRLHRVQTVPKDRNDIVEQRIEAKELREDVVESEPTLKKALDCADEILSDPKVSDKDKDEIEKYAANLTIQLRRIRDAARDEENKLNNLLIKTPEPRAPYKRAVNEELLSEENKEKAHWDLSFDDEDDDKKKQLDSFADNAEEAKSRKMQKWFDYRDQLQKIAETGKEDLANIKSMKTPTKVEEIDKHLAKTEGFIERLAEVMPIVKQSFDHGNDLLNDDDLTEKEKDTVEKDMREIREDLSEAKRDLDEHYQQMKDLRDEKCEIKVEVVDDVQAEPDVDYRKVDKKLEKLNRLRDSRNQLDELLDQLQFKLNNVKSGDTPHSRKEIKEKINEVKLCKEGIAGLDPEVKEARASAKEVLSDKDIDEEDKKPIKIYLVELEARRLDLLEQCDEESNRLGKELQQMDAEKSDKFSKWRKWRETVGDILDKLNGKLNKVKNSRTPKNRKAIEDQLNVLKDCEEGLHSSAPEMNFALDYGRHLSEDDILAENEQKTVKQETEKFEKDLNSLKMDVEKEKERLSVALDRYVAALRNELDKWGEKKHSVRQQVDKLQKKVGVVKYKLKPRKKQEILERMSEVEECKTGFKSLEPKVTSCIKHGQDLLREGNLDKHGMDTVKDDIDELKEELAKVRNEITDQQQVLKKLSEDEDKIKKDKQKKYQDWKKEIQELLQKLKSKLKRLPKSVKEVPDSETKKDDCRDLAKECSRDLDKLQDDIRDLSDYGNGLIDDGNLDAKEKRVIEDDIKRLENELDNIKKDHEVVKITIAQLNAQHSNESDHPIMEQWRNRVSKVNIGLEVAEDRLFDTTDLKSRNEIQERLQEIKELNIGFEESEPQFLETIDMGKDLLTDDEVPDNNRKEIKDDLISMAKRWGEMKTQGKEKEASLQDLLLSTTDQSDELVSWHERSDDMQAWVDDTLSLLETRPVSSVSSFGNMKRQQSVTEDVLEDLVRKQSQVNDVIDDGNRLLDDPTYGVDEKRDIHEKMSKLYSDWDTLSFSLANRQESIQDSLVQLEQQHKDLEETWRKKYGPLKKWVTNSQARLNKDFAIAPDLDSVKKQRKDIEDFQAEKQSHSPEVMEINHMADAILKGPQANEEEKTIIQNEMQELQHGWNELEESLGWKQNRIEDTIRKLENQREDKLRKWQEGLQDVNPWVLKTLETISPEPELANDVDSAYDQIDKFQTFVRDAPIYQDKVTNLNEFSTNLLTDPCLGEDERKKVLNDMAEGNKQWNELVNIANSRQARLEQNLSNLEEQQNDDFNRWTIRSGRGSELLDKFEVEMSAVDKPLAVQLEDVEKQEQEFDVFANQVELNEAQMHDTFALGENIVEDSKYSKAKRDNVQGQLNLLTSRWDRIKDFVDLRKARLEESAKRLRENRKRKFDKWEETTNEFDLFLSAAERDIRSSDSIGDEIGTVKKQNEEFKSAMSKVRSQKRKVFEYGQYTDDVIADSNLDDVSRDHIKIEKEARIDRWGHIEDMMNSQQTKLKDKLQELEKGQAEMNAWNERLTDVSNNVSKLERITEMPVGRDQDAIEKQKKEMKTVNLDIDAVDEQVSGFLTYSENLMDKQGINTENRRQIDKECDVLELKWHKAKGELERREKSLNEKQEAFNKRQNVLLSEWETRKSEVSGWITNTTAKLKTQNTQLNSLDAAKEENIKLLSIRREIISYEKNVRNLEDFADSLLLEPGIHSTERGLVTSEKQSIRERWESLNTHAHNVQKQLGDKIVDLEGEQSRRMKEWRSKAQPLDNWLNEMETDVEEYEPIAYDVPIVEKQREENQSTINNLKREKPKIEQLSKFSQTLTNETYFGLEEKVKIKEEMESLQNRWETVDKIATKRQTDIQARLSELKREERLRKQEEVLEKQRREEERKRARKDEEKRKKEDKERKAKEDKERKLREEEERERLEEEQRRREYEERKRQELERKLQEDKNEEYQKKHTILYEPRLAKPIEQEIMVQHEEIVESMEYPGDWQDLEAEGFIRQDLDTWRDDADSIRIWLKTKDGDLDEESDEEDLVGMKQQQKALMKLEYEAAQFEPKYDDVRTRYGYLIDNENLSAEDKQSLHNEMEDVKSRWEKMYLAKDLKLKRIEDKIGEKEKKKVNDLIDCRADMKNLNDWIAKKNTQFDRFDPVADDLPTVLKQREELKGFSKGLADKEPTFSQCVQSALKLSKDPTLSPDESEVMQKESENCEAKWDALNDKVKKRVDSVISVLPTMQKQQKRIMDDWDDKIDRFRKSIKKSDNTLTEHGNKYPTNEDNTMPNVDLTEELNEKVDQNETIEWRHIVDNANERLSKKRIRLQRIYREKKNRKWSIIETIKGFLGFGRKQKKAGVNLDSLIEHLQNHEDLMQEVSSQQRQANEISHSCNEIMNSKDLEKQNIEKVYSDMRNVNQEWNYINVKVVERENRLEMLAKEIEDEYEEFDSWHEKCESMNHFLNDCEKQQKGEHKIGNDIITLQKQVKDTQVLQMKVHDYNPEADDVFQMSQNLIDSGRLDKTDMEGVEHTRDALKNRWNGIKEHLKTRQENLDAILLDMVKKDADGRLWNWRDQSWKLESKLTDTHRKLNIDIDDTDFVAIQKSAVELEELQSAMDDVFSTHSEVADSGKDLVDAKTLHPQEEEEISDALNTLNTHLGNIEQSTKDKKNKIKEANMKYFERSLSQLEKSANEMEERVNRGFSDNSANIDEVQKQKENMQKLEDQITHEEEKLDDLKNKLQESKDKGLIDDSEEAHIVERINELDDTWERVNAAHGNNKKRLTHTMVVLHEELMEEIYDWLKDTEYQTNSIIIHTDDITELKKDYKIHYNLKDDITSFEPTVQRAISLSQKLLDEKIVDDERADSYNSEMKDINERMNVINLKTMDNGTKLSNAFAVFLSTYLDDAEVSLTHAESKLDQDDKGFVDLESVKKQLDFSKANMKEVLETKQNVVKIVQEANDLVDGGYFKKHEYDFFRPRIDKIVARNEALGEQAERENKRLFDTYIILLRQHLAKMDAWLFKAEEKMRSSDGIKSGYDNVKTQLDQHQDFQDEIREHSMVAMILELDITDPAVNESIQSQVKSLSERWASLWRWSEEKRTQLLRLLGSWQKFRDEQIKLLNWLSSKEKVLKEMGSTDLSNEEEVTQHLGTLKKMETDLDEQGMKLQVLHKAGEELLKDVDKDQATKDIKKQLEEFDECWNDIAKQVIDRIQSLEASQNKLSEYHLTMDDVTLWMDETEEIIGSFRVDMDPEEATKQQEKLDTKCDERSTYQVRVDRINRLGKDLQGNVDQPSYDIINDELKPFNQRWAKVSEQLENLSDNDYPTSGRRDCCLVRILRQKLGICH